MRSNMRMEATALLWCFGHLWSKSSSFLFTVLNLLSLRYVATVHHLVVTIWVKLRCTAQTTSQFETNRPVAFIFTYTHLIWGQVNNFLPLKNCNFLWQKKKKKSINSSVKFEDTGHVYRLKVTHITAASEDDRDFIPMLRSCHHACLRSSVLHSSGSQPPCSIYSHTAVITTQGILAKSSSNQLNLDWEELNLRIHLIGALWPWRSARHLKVKLSNP